MVTESDEPTWSEYLKKYGMLATATLPLCTLLGSVLILVGVFLLEPGISALGASSHLRSSDSYVLACAGGCGLFLACASGCLMYATGFGARHVGKLVDDHPHRRAYVLSWYALSFFLPALPFFLFALGVPANASVASLALVPIVAIAIGVVVSAWDGAEHPSDRPGLEAFANHLFSSCAGYVFWFVIWLYLKEPGFSRLMIVLLAVASVIVLNTGSAMSRQTWRHLAGTAAVVLILSSSVWFFDSRAALALSRATAETVGLADVRYFAVALKGEACDSASLDFDVAELGDICRISPVTIMNRNSESIIVRDAASGHTREFRLDDLVSTTLLE